MAKMGDAHFWFVYVLGIVFIGVAAWGLTLLSPFGAPPWPVYGIYGFPVAIWSLAWSLMVDERSR